MVARLVKALVADVVMVVAAYFVTADLQWRSGYAASEGLTPSTSYLPFIRVFTMTGRSFPLQSPPTLDWLQVLAAAFILVNIWYAAGALANRRKGSPQV